MTQELTAVLTPHSLKGTAKIISINLVESIGHGFLIAEIADGSYISVNFNAQVFALVSKEGDIIDLDFEWKLNKELNILERDIFASKDNKEFSKIDMKNLSYEERLAKCNNSFDLRSRVFTTHHISFTI